MLATLAEFKLIEAIIRDQSSDTNRDLAAALADAGFLEGGLPRVAAVRVPMESEYREFWELPYDTMIKTKLAHSLIQARAMLGLIRNLTASGERNIAEVEFLPREASVAQVEQIGGLEAPGIQARALAVERAIYSISAGLSPPPLDKFPADATAPYQPFDALKAVRIDWDGENVDLVPLAILDDVHSLHPDQLNELYKILARREIKFGRWMMMRIEALSAGDVLNDQSASAMPNLKPDRDFIDIRMQGQTERGQERRQFRSMAMDMANRYMPEVQILKSRNATRFERLVPSTPPRLTASQLQKLSGSVDEAQRRLEIGVSRREDINTFVENYLKSTTVADKTPEIKLAMIAILLHRYFNRISHSTLSLFDDLDPDPRIPLKATAQVAEAARLHLNEEFARPFHFGVDDVCDASNENAETFLQLAGTLVARMESRVIRNKSPDLPAKVQQEVLKAKAQEIIAGWSFPFSAEVRAMITLIGQECRDVSLTPNARLAPGANAIGILENEMRPIVDGNDKTAMVLKYGVAYGAIELQRNYGQGGKSWCLIELSGVVCLHFGLTFKRGGFLEKDSEYLIALCD